VAREREEVGEWHGRRPSRHANTTKLYMLPTGWQRGLPTCAGLPRGTAGGGSGVGGVHAVVKEATANPRRRTIGARRCGRGVHEACWSAADSRSKRWLFATAAAPAPAFECAPVWVTTRPPFTAFQPPDRLRLAAHAAAALTIVSAFRSPSIRLTSLFPHPAPCSLSPSARPTSLCAPPAIPEPVHPDDQRSRHALTSPLPHARGSSPSRSRPRHTGGSKRARDTTGSTWTWPARQSYTRRSPNTPTRMRTSTSSEVVSFTLRQTARSCLAEAPAEVFSSHPMLLPRAPSILLPKRMYERRKVKKGRERLLRQIVHTAKEVSSGRTGWACA